MKVYRFLIVITLFMAALTVVMTGCKYDVAQPGWDKPYVEPPIPSVTGISPAQEARPGVNFITIQGQNFAQLPDSNLIYFNAYLAEVAQISSNSIKVRRPNIAADSCTVKVVSPKADVVAEYGPYKIDPVLVQYGSLVANVQLSTVTLDNAGNLYVVETKTRNLWKITPDGQRTQVGGTDTLTRAPSDAKISPIDGNIYYLNSVFPNTKEVRMLNLTTGRDSLWHTMSPLKNVICGDFAANGWFYTGGRRSGIVVLRPDGSQRADGYYATDTISNMRVFNGYVYVQIRTAIYRHLLNDTNVVGTQEQVLNLTQGIFASRSIKSFSFSADGSTMYLGTDSPDPLLIVDLTTGNADILYKGILPSYCKQFCFGNKLYMISGNVTPAVNWTVYQVDVGATGAPYY